MHVCYIHLSVELEVFGHNLLGAVNFLHAVIGLGVEDGANPPSGRGMEQVVVTFRNAAERNKFQMGLILKMKSKGSLFRSRNTLAAVSLNLPR